MTAGGTRTPTVSVTAGPPPGEARSGLPGPALARTISPGTVREGADGRATVTSGTAATTATGA